ncbi:MAG: sulfurtransferase TusA family protein [Lentisphaeraceae bacterium]|nr:sulfurtransferase TusA family protein [Lentisphaeraceae bacterium]
MTRALELEMDSVVLDEIQEFTEKLNGFIDGSIHPEDWQKRRLWQGIYGQRQPDVSMIRIKIPYGIGTTKQFRAIANLSKKVTNGILHITTRAALQLHYIPKEMTPEVLTGIAEVGITSREACGNVVRAVTADPYAAITPDQVFNVIPLAEFLFKHCLRNPYSQNFPRKFKISFSGNEEGDYGLSFMHDIGFIASEKDGKYTLNVYAAGGLGGRPIGADLIEKDMAIEDILICTTALMRIFNEFGNRKNRNKARMKFIKDTWGLEEFIRKYQEEVNRIKDSEYGKSLLVDVSTLDLDLPKESADISKLAGVVEDSLWLENCVFAQNTVDTYGIRVRVRMGDLTSEQMHSLCDIVDSCGDGEIRSTCDQNLILPNIALNKIPEAYAKLKELGYDSWEFKNISNVVACPGRSTCNLSVTSSKGLADALITAFDADASLKEGVSDAQINISGCHNGCGQHALGSIGFNGSSRMIDGKAVPCAVMSIGGGAKDGIRQMGRRLGRVAAKKAPEAVKALIDHYKANAPEGQIFSQYLAEIDPKTIKDVVKPFDQISSYADEPEVFLDYGMEEGEEYSPAVGAGECAGGVLNLVTESFDDSKNYINMAEDVLAKGFFGDVYFNAREAVLHTMSGALIEAGESEKKFDAAWDLYSKFYGSNDKLPVRPDVQDEKKDLDEAAAKTLLTDAKAYCEKVLALYREDHANLKPAQDEEAVTSLDLRGIACPINYVKAKMALEKLADADSLEMQIDTGEAYRMVPASLREDGHKVVELAPSEDETYYILVVLKNGLK